MTQTDNSIRLGDITDSELRRNVSISYDVTVPFNTRLKSRSGAGSVNVDSVQGPVEARTGSGRIQLGKIDRERRR